MMYSLTGPLLQLLWKRMLWNDYLIKLFRELKFRDVQEGWEEGNTEKAKHSNNQHNKNMRRY